MKWRYMNRIDIIAFISGHIHGVVMGHKTYNPHTLVALLTSERKLEKESIKEA